MIYFNNVTKHYNDKDRSITNVDLTINQGEFVSIVGHSGSGKTTLIKLLLNEVKPNSGTVFFENQDIHKLKGSAITTYRRRIGVVFQDFRLLPNKTAFENVAFAMEVAGRSDEDIVTDVPYALELVGLSNKAYDFPHEMSGGEKQRLAIARAIINQPEVIIADEPTGNLDPVATKEVIGILKKINDLGTTVILTTHNTDVVNNLGKRVVHLENGRITNDEKVGMYPHHHAK
ncbi:MAG TPA: cell division ATP-binding protein FtsE [Candidatus Paceibacterota bacterium]|nr:cell division ATP-binding protein FtsE [Candidatus Paceibacterota bacterium]